MTVTITGLDEVVRKLKALPLKLQKSIGKKMQRAAVKSAVPNIRSEITGNVAWFKKFVQLDKSGHIGRLKKTTKGQTTQLAEAAMQDLRKSIGVNIVPLWKMKNKAIRLGYAGPRAGFKIRGMVNKKGGEPAATTVARMMERGTSISTPNPFTRRALERSKAGFEEAMAEAGREAIAKAGEHG